MLRIEHPPNLRQISSLPIHPFGKCLPFCGGNSFHNRDPGEASTRRSRDTGCATDCRGLLYAARLKSSAVISMYTLEKNTFDCRRSTADKLIMAETPDRLVSFCNSNRRQPVLRTIGRAPSPANEPRRAIFRQQIKQIVLHANLLLASISGLFVLCIGRPGVNHGENR
jgi:hypothetical protein